MVLIGYRDGQQQLEFEVGQVDGQQTGCVEGETALIDVTIGPEELEDRTGLQQAVETWPAVVQEQEDVTESGAMQGMEHGSGALESEVKVGGDTGALQTVSKVDRENSEQVKTQRKRSRAGRSQRKKPLLSAVVEELERYRASCVPWSEEGQGRRLRRRLGEELERIGGRVGSRVREKVDKGLGMGRRQVGQLDELHQGGLGGRGGMGSVVKGGGQSEGGRVWGEAGRDGGMGQGQGGKGKKKSSSGSHSSSSSSSAKVIFKQL